MRHLATFPFGCSSEDKMFRNRWISLVVILMTVIAAAEAWSQSGVSLQEPEGELNLHQALQLAYQHNPELIVSDWSIRASEARKIQAGLLPNPVLSAESENIGGSDPYRGFDEAENTFQIEQPLLIGGKRSNRVRLADTERNLAEWDYKAKRLDLSVAVTRSFFGVLAGQRRLEVRQDIVDLAEGIAAIVAARIRAGKVSPIEQTSADIRVANARNARIQAEKLLERERQRLATLWGNPAPVFTEVVSDLDVLTPPPSLESLSVLLPRNPRIARWEEEASQREAKLALEKSNRIPDLTLTGGLRHFSGTGTEAFVVGLGIPLPVFNRNQGSIREARLFQELVGKEKRVEEMSIQRDLADVYQVLSSTYENVVALQNQIIPAARSALESVEKGYRQGKFGYLDVIQAQRTLFESREQEVETLAAYHQSVAMVEGLIGGDMSPGSLPVEGE